MLIVQSNEFTRGAILAAIAARITRIVRLAQAPGNVKLSKRSSRLRKESVVNVSQLITLDKVYPSERAGEVPGHIPREVDVGLRIALSIYKRVRLKAATHYAQNLLFARCVPAAA